MIHTEHHSIMISFGGSSTTMHIEFLIPDFLLYVHGPPSIMLILHNFKRSWMTCWKMNYGHGMSYGLVRDPEDYKEFISSQSRIIPELSVMTGWSNDLFKFHPTTCSSSHPQKSLWFWKMADYFDQSSKIPVRLIFTDVCIYKTIVWCFQSAHQKYPIVE